MSPLHELKVVKKCSVSPATGKFGETCSITLHSASSASSSTILHCLQFRQLLRALLLTPCVAARFHPFLPFLPEKAILSVQVTLFHNYGIANCTTLHHVAAEGSSYTHFMKTCVAISKLGDNIALFHFPQPFFECVLISNTRGIEGLFIKDTEDLKIERRSVVWDLSCMPNVVQATFVLGPNDIRRQGLRTVPRCSPYTFVCGLTLVNLLHAWV
ncbi:hypothetical protein HPP92_020576 [Vanilla planifolia]|uniref:Uncharacterized protein n=1 Tax=Vanilla planifolia TaxID=51239 RepID=A0A835Q815_VANPL|nr:hypothetical protein HPP92_020576 [Vanilla planifolia]